MLSRGWLFNFRGFPNRSNTSRDNCVSFPCDGFDRQTASLKLILDTFTGPIDTYRDFRWIIPRKLITFFLSQLGLYLVKNWDIPMNILHRKENNLLRMKLKEVPENFESKITLRRFWLNSPIFMFLLRKLTYFNM